jgi:UDP-N-acetylmuramate--alanine ligase
MYDTSLSFHFVGIGGSGMSGIAEVLLNCGFGISGSDLVFSEPCRRLQSLGANIQVGHLAENVPTDASLLVYSSAVRPENPEVQEARRRGIPVVPRAEVLAELMRLKFGIGVAGAHGKTTTTSMIGTMLEHAGLDPTVIIGGVIKSMCTGGKLGQGQFLVAETDESDRSFLRLKPSVAIITNIDSEHMEAYESMQDLIDSFEEYANSIPFYGLAIFCMDDERVANIASSYAKRKVTYGIHAPADIQAERITPEKFSVRYDLIIHGKNVGVVHLPVPGRHAVQNSLAAVAVGLELKLKSEQIIAALEKFEGVERRFDIVRTAEPTVINDYGHHPTEIRSVISAIREGWKIEDRKIHVVFQPHRYTRTRDCFGEFLTAFDGADSVLIAPIYAASENPIPGITSEALTKALSHPNARCFADFDQMEQALFADVKPDDIVLCLGAGTIGGFSKRLASAVNWQSAEGAVACNG